MGQMVKMNLYCISRLKITNNCANTALKYNINGINRLLSSCVDVIFKNLQLLIEKI